MHRLDPPHRILVVEDSPDLRALWEACLTRSGFIVDVAVNGADGVAKARAIRPDLVLMDLSMPVMDGLEAIGRLRADVTMADVVIVALTALDTEDAARQAEAVGADVYVDKPVMPDVLVRQLDAALTRPSERARAMVRVRRDGREG